MNFGDIIVNLYLAVFIFMAGWSLMFYDVFNSEVFFMAGSIILLSMIVFSFCVSVTVVINKFRRR